MPPRVCHHSGGATPRGEVSMHRQSTTPTAPCIICGSHFRLFHSRVARGGTKYCSRACRLADNVRTLPERFASRVERTDTCWLWRGSQFRQGYGRICVKSKITVAHRVAWELRTGEPIPSGFEILHTCDNPPCVRNDDEGTYELNGLLYLRYGHLYIGTNEDNHRDKVSKRRHPFGTAINTSKLVPSQVITIRRRFADGEGRGPLAREFGVSWENINSIVTRESWKHVP